MFKWQDISQQINCLEEHKQELAMLDEKKRTNMFMLIFLILTLLAICTLTTPGGVEINSPTPSNNLEKAPVRKVDITLAQNQHDQLFEQFRNFAGTHAFAIRISQTDPTGENFLVQMWRENIRIIGADSRDPGLFEIGLYNTYEERPVPSRVFDELIVDLRELIMEIPNTTFTVKD